MMKYVCFKNHESGDEEIMMFPKSINHDCFAEIQGRIKNQIDGDWHRVMRTPISAGFVVIADGKPKCFGKSITLGLESRGQDSSILLNQMDE